eukprot:5868405-Pleurochrysis_carterae.AAC.2
MLAVTSLVAPLFLLCPSKPLSRLVTSWRRTNPQKTSMGLAAIDPWGERSSMWIAASKLHDVPHPKTGRCAPIPPSSSCGFRVRLLAVMRAGDVAHALHDASRHCGGRQRVPPP